MVPLVEKMGVNVLTNLVNAGYPLRVPKILHG